MVNGGIAEVQISKSRVGIAGGDGIVVFRVEIREYRVEISTYGLFSTTDYRLPTSD
jgi:hypothetical protein